MVLSQTENKLGEQSSSKPTKVLSDAEINEKYEKGEHRFLTEMNREKLPSFVAALEKDGYLETRPFYQRRDRWDEKKQSKLIESFLINIPVIGQARESGKITRWFPIPKSTKAKLNQVTLSVGDIVCLVSETKAYCQVAVVESIMISENQEEVTKETVEITDELEVGLKFNTDAQKGLSIYLCE